MDSGGLFIWVPKYHFAPKVLARCQNALPKVSARNAISASRCIDPISHAVEKPPDNQNEGEPSYEASQSKAEPPAGAGGSQSWHQRMRVFRKRYQRGGNPSIAQQSSGKGRARRSLESCTNYCQRLLSSLASMVTWARLKMIATLIQLLAFARTTFYYCKGMVTWAQLKTLAILISLLPFVKTAFSLCKVIMKFCSSSYDIGSDFLQGK